MLEIDPYARFEKDRDQYPSRTDRLGSTWQEHEAATTTWRGTTQTRSSRVWQYLTFVLLAVSFLLTSIFPAAAQQRIINPGNAVVTGFSGIVPNGLAIAPGVNPLDGFFINLAGPSVQIMSLSAAGGAPQGQLVSAPGVFQLNAGQIGQVFAVALDNGLGGKTPNIYLGATSLFGINIVKPDSDGDGLPERLKNGHANARWMAGQFGPGQEPGAIWRVDGVSGAEIQFTTLPGNSGPGVGDIVFDAKHRQFFASDVDNGVVYRIGENGNIIDSYDHGLTGRAAMGLAPVGDDGIIMDISNPAFDTQNPATWGYTQSERQVWGMAMRGDRLYYAVKDGLQVFSIGIANDGGFNGDPRWELDAKDLPGTGPITDMLFDKTGRIYLAQRGAPRGSYDYSTFAAPGQSSVIRYAKESPDNPATPSTWVPIAQGYAIGMTPPHQQTNGGIALGYDHDENGAHRARSCSSMIWSTGSRLRASAADGIEADVHGLQGNAIEKVGLANVPPVNSYFVDYDGIFGDPEKAGHMGDVEIWQPCDRDLAADDGLPPGYFPPSDTPPGDLPPEFPPPHHHYKTNLKLTKRAAPKTCIAYAGGWGCRYKVRVRNMGPDAYFGDILVNDYLPAAPAGALMGFSPAASWSCWNAGAASYNCYRPDTFLAPGAGVELLVYTWVPRSYRRCSLRNKARILWAPGGTQWNTNPADDADSATAFIPAENCPPRDRKRTNLKLEKKADPEQCSQAPNGYRCRYRITVTNTGPGVYNGEIHVQDQPPALTTATVAPGPWSCVNAGGNYNCAYPATTLNPGDQVELRIGLYVPYDVARIKKFRITNKARITFAPGGSPQNTNPGDDADQATAFIDNDNLCGQLPPPTNTPVSCPPGYRPFGNSCVSKPVSCPAGWTKTPVRGKCCPPGKRWNGSKCDRPGNNTPPTDTPQDDPPTLRCPKGTTGIYPRCRPIVNERPRCPKGTVGRYPRCRPIVTERPRCPRGTIGRYPRCRTINVTPPRRCPQGTIGRYPRCRTINVTPTRKCPQGTIGRYPRCRTINVTPTRKCPQGTIGIYPRCRTINVAPTRKCPKGTVGRYPRCKKKVNRVPSNVNKKLRIRKPAVRTPRRLQLQRGKLGSNFSRLRSAKRN